MFTILIIALLALVSIGITSYTRKKDEKDKPVIFVWGNIVCMAGIVLATAVSQLSNSSDDKVYKKAVLELELLARVNEFTIPVFENYAEIINNFNVVKNYIYQVEAKNMNPDAAPLLEKQMEKMRNQNSFQEASRALKNLKSIAAQIHGLHLQHGDTVPKELIEWAGVVSKIKIETIDQYFDPYARNGNLPSKTVLNFFELSGRAFGVSIGRARQATENIKSVIK